ncbi:FAD-dependent oxidoreductase [Rhodococcus sp. NCIMB 12038]|jgi:ferredoxin--NADP+ reductase|uniref:FAD-dependent oxidoreductase n=1 Tax=Rhodococcus sp. NCIMB 12038 TaxID=933800 RepID=UPI000B3D2A3E|nr:FAD-dependent oxidoreductase [Rhodococcus sp. NCIMB 12038]OUS83513.1 hypothetical protein CA951_40805 [Rhodococcus sp. NCIMB 12038]
MTPTRPSAATSQTGSDLPLRVAIIGAGPSGCFTAQALRKRIPNIQISVFDSLPTPYGLVRHGIAPDHQGAKAVQRQFDRLFAQDGVRFVGNTRIGDDVPFANLAEAFDAVVLATGLALDRGLGVPQDERARVIGAGSLLRLLNSDPDSPLRRVTEGVPELGRDIAIVGTGNVAVDVARLLTKSAAELAKSDIDDKALHALIPHGLETIHVIGRSGRESAKWEHSMLKELASVESVDLRFDGEPFDPASHPAEKSVHIDVRFRQITQSVTTTGSKTLLTTCEAGDPSTTSRFLVDAVISAIGFEDDSQLSIGLDAPQIFRVGGCASGRLGNLAENRKLAAAAAQQIAEYLAREDRAVPGGDDIDRMLPARHITFDGWRRIEEAEALRARPQRCRTKFTTRDELLAAAQPVVDRLAISD